MMNRRQFLEKTGHGTLGTALLAATAGGSTFLLTGCDIESTIKAWVPVAIASFNGVLTLLEGAAVITPGAGTAVALAISLIKAGLADVLAAVDEYKSAPASSKTTFAQKLSIILASLRDNFGKFWSDLNLPGGSLVTLVTGFAQIILSAIGGFLQQLPSAAPTVATVFKVGGVQATAQAKKMSANDFKKQINNLFIQSGHPELVVA